MSYDDRLIIKHEFEMNGLPRVNKLKLVENVEFVQVWLNNGSDKTTNFRLDAHQVRQLKEYLEKVEIRC